MAIQGSVDPFKPVLDLLNQLATDVAPVADKVHTAASDVDQVQQCLTDILTLQSDVANAIQGMTEVQELCSSLTDIPVVGEFAGTAASAIGAAVGTITRIKSAIDNVIRTTVQPAQTALTQVQSNLTDLDTCLQDIVKGVPIADNTIAILQALAQIVSSLALALGGTTVGDRLNGLLTDYAALRDAIEADAEALQPFLTAVETAIDAVASAFDAVTSLTSDVASALSDVGSVSSILDPIRSAMNAIESAIAPVQWALDAVSCIFDEVVEPVIDALEDSLGLSGLVDSLEGSLTSALGIDRIVTSITSDLQLQALIDFETSVGTQATSLVNGWSGLQALFAQYSVGGGSPKDAAIQQLVDAITGAPAGAGPAPVTAWPPPGTIYKPPTLAATPSIYGPCLTRIQAALALVAAPASAPLAQTAADIGGDDAPPTPLKPLGPQWAAVTALGSTVETNIGALGALTLALAALGARAAQFQKTVGFAGVLGHQLADIATDLQTAADTLALLQELPGLGSVTPPIATAVQGQISACAASQANVTQLQQNVDAVTGAVQAALAQAPNSALVAATTGRLNGWKHGGEMLARAIDRGRCVTQTPTSPAALDLRATQLTARAVALQAAAQAIGQSAAALTASVQGIDQQLQAYGNGLLAIAADGVTVSAQGQTNTDQIAHLLSVIDSLINPLSLLMGPLGCAAPDATQPANEALKTVIAVSTAGATNATNAVSGLLSDLLARALPTAAITREADHANALLSGQILPQLQAATTTLGQELAAMSRNMNQDLTYTVQPNGGAPVSVTNAYLDDETASGAMALNTSLSPPPLAIGA